MCSDHYVVCLEDPGTGLCEERKISRFTFKELINSYECRDLIQWEIEKMLVCLKIKCYARDIGFVDG